MTKDNFGLLIAYLLPGFVCLWGIAYHSPVVRAWLHAMPPDSPTIGGFLYATLASTAAGLIVSAVRWALIDRAFSCVGVRPPTWDIRLLPERLAAFETLVAHHYCYYQFYANTLVAAAFAYLARLTAAGALSAHEGRVLTGFAFVEGILVVGSWDTLRKYYARTGALLSAAVASKRTAPGREEAAGSSAIRSLPAYPRSFPGASLARSVITIASATRETCAIARTMPARRLRRARLLGQGGGTTSAPQNRRIASASESGVASRAGSKGRD